MNKNIHTNHGAESFDMRSRNKDLTVVLGNLVDDLPSNHFPLTSDSLFVPF